MNIDCFLKRFSRVLISSDGDSMFEAFKVWVGGTTSPKIAKLLNFAVSQMDAGECYVETGVFTGTTLISAHWANGKPCVGIDSYSENLKEASVLQADAVRDLARQNIARLASEARLIEKDFRDVNPDEIPGKIAVAFIDAMHTEKDVMDNLLWLEPMLAKDALIFFDDANHEGVYKAIFGWLNMRPETTHLLCHIQPHYRDAAYMSSVEDRVLNNGFSIILHHRGP